MSGIYIKGMEMPRCCAECDAEGHYEDSYGDEYGFFCPFGYKAYTSETRELKRLDDCPLIPAADVRPVVRGEWKHDGFNWFCDRCNYNALCDKETGEEVLSQRCPNCGADMRRIADET